MKESSVLDMKEEEIEELGSKNQLLKHLPDDQSCQFSWSAERPVPVPTLSSTPFRGC